MRGKWDNANSFAGLEKRNSQSQLRFNQLTTSFELYPTLTQLRGSRSLANYIGHI